MAILFVSPQKKQRSLMWSIILFIVFILLIVFFTVFPPEFLYSPKTSQVNFTTPGVKVNLNILNSDQVRNLETFSSETSQGAIKGRSEPFSPY